MDPFLERFRNSEVEVLYRTDNAMYTDRGRLVDATASWLELAKGAKGRSETFLIPVSAIRIMKVVGPPDEPAARLLRPADVPAEQEVEPRG